MRCGCWQRAGGYKLKKRPHSERLVGDLSHFFEVLVWSADEPPAVQMALQQWGLPVTACLSADTMSRRHGRRVKASPRAAKKFKNSPRSPTLTLKKEEKARKIHWNSIRYRKFNTRSTRSLTLALEKGEKPCKVHAYSTTYLRCNMDSTRLPAFHSFKARKATRNPLNVNYYTNYGFSLLKKATQILLIFNSITRIQHELNMSSSFSLF